MTNLGDAERVTRRLVELTSELRAEATRTDGDFGRMVEIADEIGGLADGVAEALARIDEILARRLAQARGDADAPGANREDLVAALSPGRGARAKATEDGKERLTKSELYARARAAGIPGRSRMSRDELIEALRSRGSDG